MLFAELHGKLDPNAPDLERREDVLTSTTFGTLIVANATDMLVDWLNFARRFGPLGRLDQEPLGLADEPPVKYWFWPTLTNAQPDVVLRIGRRLLVVEAKYGSAKSKSRTRNDSADPDAAAFMPIPDQLLREWQAVQPTVRGLGRYPEDLRDAIETRDRQLVYLVSARSSALRELADSQAKIRRATSENVPHLLYGVLRDCRVPGGGRP